MKRSLTTGLALLLATSATAQDAPEVPAEADPAAMVAEAPDMMDAAAPEMSIAFGTSSLGLNIEAAYRLNPTYRVRGVFMGGIDVDYDESDEDGDFSGNLTLGGLAVMGDFYPLQSSWRVSGGLLLSNSELSATGTADVEGTGNVDATIEASFANDIAPMITTGFDTQLAPGWSLNTETGLIFTGGIDLEYTANDPTLQDELDNDPDLQDAKDDLSDISIFPYVSVTVSYTF